MAGVSFGVLERRCAGTDGTSKFMSVLMMRVIACEQVVCSCCGAMLWDLQCKWAEEQGPKVECVHS